MKKIILIILLLFEISLILASTPPSLPVIIDGKIVNEDGKVIPKILVKVTYTNNGKITSATTTITKEDGSYKFELQDVQDGSEIIVESGGKKQYYIATSGIRISGDKLKVDRELVESDGTKTQFIGKFVSFISGLFYSKEKEDIKINGSEKFIAKEQFGGANKSDANNEEENTKQIKPNESFPSIPDIEVVNGKYTEYKENQEKILSNGSSNEDNSELEDPVYSEGIIEKYFYNLNMSEPVILQSYSKLVKNIVNYDSKKNYKNYLYYIVYTIGLIFTLIIFVLLFYLIKKSIKYIMHIFSNPVKESINKIQTEKTFNIMIKNPTTLNEEDNCLEALDMFVHNNISIIPVISYGRVSGVIRKRDLLVGIKDKNFESIERMKVGKIMRKNFVSVKQNLSTGDLYLLMLEKNVNEAVVIDKNNTLYGTIDYFDILKLFDNADFTIEHPPILGEVMNKEISQVDYQTSLYKLLERFLEKNVDYAIINKDKKAIGIVTIKDILGAINNNIDLKSNNCQTIMSGNLVMMTPGTSIYKAFRMAIDRRYNQIPIVLDGKVSGIVNVRGLVNLYYEFISGINTCIKDEIYKKTIKDLNKGN
ncbi:MAG: CBS domain-containing protein [Candidatus Pacearchaeota archaeon]|jgi:CBS domain-containing protein